MRIWKVVLVVLLSVVVSLVLGVQCGEYHSGVSYPSGTMYVIELKYDSVESSNRTVNIENLTVHAEVTLTSKDIDLNYVGWGFYVNGTGRKYENGSMVEEREMDYPIPPILLAVKKNTRELHPTDLLIDLIRGKYEDAEILEILSGAYTAHPVEDIFMYNIFYIEQGRGPGDKIIFGFVNSSANEEKTKEFEISYEKEIELPCGKLNTLVIEIDADTMKFLEDLIEDELNISEASYIRFYYEKNTGWLVKAEAYGEAMGKNDENVTKVMTVNLDVVLKKPGSIPIGGNRGLNNILGLPKFTMETAATILIVAIIYFKVARRRA